MSTPDIQRVAEHVSENVGQVMVGKARVVRHMLVALLCEGHILLEDVPGIGKTTLAKALAKSLGASYSRIQFTPDLLPSDVLGVSVFDQRQVTFAFQPGPVFAQVILADEINRASPRTQSALLEAMQERQVTVDGETRPLPRPFLVMATQNPVELEGTFPLPEAQLDRFLMRLSLGYPSEDEERAILRRFRTDEPLAGIEPVVEADELLRLGEACRRVYIHPVIEDYVLALVRATRTSEALTLGASPRGSLALCRTGQALAAIRGRDYVTPQDIQDLIEPVLAHRLIPSTSRRLHGDTAREVLREVIARVPVPVEERWEGSPEA